MTPPMKHPKNQEIDHDIVGPGQPRQSYMAQLAATGYTGWYDAAGRPAPWPEDFLDPNSGWHPPGE